MSEKDLRVRVSQIYIDILDELKEKKDIKSYAGAIRYAILSLADKENISVDNSLKEMKIKLNTVTKNVDMLMEMVAGGFDFQDVNAIRKKEDTYIYADAKKNVENEIQRSTTIKSNFKKSNVERKEKEERKESKTDFSRNFY